MKVLLFSGHSAVTFTKEMEKILNKSKFPYNRTGEIIDYVEKNFVKMNADSIEEAIQTAKNNQETIYKLYETKNEDIYHIWNKEYGYLSSITIYDVDISRPWTIAEYDGAEYVQYLDYEYTVPEMNYAKLKEQI